MVDLEREGGGDANYSRSVPVLISVQRIAFLSAQLASLQNRSDAQLESLDPVSYTHLTLPTNREV